MKRLLLLFVSVICSLCIWADKTCTLKLDGAVTQSTAGYFTVNTGGGFNTKYTGKYSGVTYSKGLKINSSSEITFTNKGTATVVIVQSTSSNGSNRFKFDGSAVENSVGVDNPNTGDVTVREYTLTDVAAGTHTITNDTETGLLYVSVTEVSSNSPVVENMALSSTYALGTPVATPLAVEVAMVNEDNDVLEYQWFVNGTNSTDGGTAISGANSASYTPDISAVGILYYYCVIVEKDADNNQVGNSAVTNTVAIEVISSVEAPVFSEINGTVELSCATSAATIYHSLDNGTTWIEYKKPFTILDDDVTVSARSQVGGGTLVSQVVTHAVEAIKAKAGSSSIVLYYNTTDMQLGENEEGASNAALIGNEGTEYEDWMLQIKKALEGNKTLQNGNSISGYASIKNSNGREISVLLPAGVVANRITIYSYVNRSTASSQKNYWSEVCGQTYGTSSIAMGAFADATKPDIRVYALNDVEDEITFNNNGVSQICFYAVVDYTIVEGSVVLNSKGFATYSGEKNVMVEGAQAYTCTVNGTDIDAQPISGNVVPAYSGVLLYGEPNATVTLNYQKTATALGSNDLKPTTTSEGLAPLEEALVLSGNVFKSYTGANFDANKAYLPYELFEETAVPAKGCSINFHDAEEEATAVTTVTETTVGTGVRTVFKNGQLVIETADGEFTLAGARIK